MSIVWPINKKKGSTDGGCNMDEPWKHAKLKELVTRPHSVSSICTKYSRVGTSIETECRVHLKERGLGSSCLMDSVSFWVNGTVLKLERGDGCIKLWMYWMPLKLHF